jgi:hypothetical protein
MPTWKHTRSPPQSQCCCQGYFWSLNVVGTVRDTSSINKFHVEKVISVKVPIETKARVVEYFSRSAPDHPTKTHDALSSPGSHTQSLEVTTSDAQRITNGSWSNLQPTQGRPHPSMSRPRAVDANLDPSMQAVPCSGCHGAAQKGSETHVQTQ